MERSQLFDLMGELQLYGMKAAFDEIMSTAVKRQHVDNGPSKRVAEETISRTPVAITDVFSGLPALQYVRKIGADEK
jgi:hypothetical protein